MSVIAEIAQFGKDLTLAAGKSMLRAVQNIGKSSPPVYSVSPGLQSFGLAVSANPTAVLQAYRGWSAACVDAIADDCARIALRFFDSRNDKELPPDHPTVQLFKNPCPGVFAAFAFKKLIYSWMEIEGDAFLYKARDSLGVIRQLMPIMPDRMYVVPDDINLIKGYLFRYMGKTIAFDKTEIVHLRYPNPLDLLRGMGTIEKAAYEYDAELYLKKYRISIFKNRGRPDGVLETDQDLDEDDIERVREQWHKAYGTVDRAGKLAVLQQGLTYKPVQVSPADLDFLQGSAVTRDELIGLFRVPAAKLGLIEDVNRANGYELERTYQESVIKPKLILVREQWQAEVVDEFDDRILARHDENVPHDKEFSLKEEDLDVKNAVQTINEIRARRGLDPVPWGDTPWVPFNMVPIGSTPQDKGENAIRIIRQPIIESRDEEAVMAGLWRQYYALHTPLANHFERSLQGLFSDQKKEVLRNLKKADEAQKTVRIPLEIDFILFSLEEAMKIFAETADPHFREILLAGLRKGFTDVGAEIDPVIGERLSRWLDIRKEKFSFEVNDTTLRSLKDELTVGLQSGESIQEIAARVNKVFDFADSYRAERIAVTETTGASNKGILQAYADVPMDLIKAWLTSRLSNRREWHISMDNQERDLAEPFISGIGNAFMFPGDPDCGDPSDIVNCHCTLMPKKKE